MGHLRMGEFVPYSILVLQPKGTQIMRRISHPLDSQYVCLCLILSPEHYSTVVRRVYLDGELHRKIQVVKRLFRIQCIVHPGRGGSIVTGNWFVSLYLFEVVRSLVSLIFVYTPSSGCVVADGIIGRNAVKYCDSWQELSRGSGRRYADWTEDEFGGRR